jgi:cysteine desulfurase
MVVYLDNASTTPLHPDVKDAMLPYLDKFFGNPSGIYRIGKDARRAIDDARELISEKIGCHPTEFIFTSGATEANNLAIVGVAEANRHRGRHIITSAIEHHSVLEPVGGLRERGFEVSYVGVDRGGVINAGEVAGRIREDTILVSIMSANNEVGTIQPIYEIARVCRQRGVMFHTDAVQLLGKAKIDLGKHGIDAASFSAHKIHGPKGVGGLFIRREVNIKPIILGGGQEFERRAGTENVAGIVGFAKAVEVVHKNMEKSCFRMQRLRQRLKDGLLKLGGTFINGDETVGLPNILNVTFKGIPAEAILIRLDEVGICASAGSACGALSAEISHVLLAMGLTAEQARSSIRFSLSLFTTAKEIDYVVRKVSQIIKELRR